VRVQRTVELAAGRTAVVSLDEPLVRNPDNPILTAHQVNDVWREPHRRVVTVHNAGAVALPGGDTVMLFRSHLRCGISVVGLARSADGVTGWAVAPEPVLKPATAEDVFAPGIDAAEIVEMEGGGCEDARINPVFEQAGPLDAARPRPAQFTGTYAITYSAYHAEIKNRVRVSLALTDDFQQYVRYGPMLDHDMRNVVLFPEKINGQYVGLFRPNDDLPGDTGGIYRQIRIGYADDLRTGPWKIDDVPVMQMRGGPSAFADKVGPCTPPVRTKHGWLQVFHGVRSTMDGNPYVLGVALHDFDDPRTARVSSIPVLFPSAADCRVAETDYVHVPNVVFSCGMVRRDDGAVLVYYGGNDTVMNVAIGHEDVFAELCTRYGQDPLTGRLQYPL
jgi:predicted GH43/DUF377 family glycosyl hydrolase